MQKTVLFVRQNLKIKYLIIYLTNLVEIYNKSPNIVII